MRMAWILGGSPGLLLQHISSPHTTCTHVTQAHTFTVHFVTFLLALISPTPFLPHCIVPEASRPRGNIPAITPHGHVQWGRGCAWERCLAQHSGLGSRQR